jgi:hypothetical protein
MTLRTPRGHRWPDTGWHSFGEAVDLADRHRLDEIRVRPDSPDARLLSMHLQAAGHSWRDVRRVAPVDPDGPPHTVDLVWDAVERGRPEQARMSMGDPYAVCLAHSLRANGWARDQIAAVFDTTAEGLAELIGPPPAPRPPGEPEF